MRLAIHARVAFARPLGAQAPGPRKARVAVVLAVQLAEPVAANFPTAQCAQPVAPVVAAAAEYLPAAHETHAATPVATVLEYLPEAQGVQAVAPVLEE